MITMLNALAPAGSHTAQNVSIMLRFRNGTLTTVRYSGTSNTIEGTNRVASTKAMMRFPNLGRRTRERISSGRRHVI